MCLEQVSGQNFLFFYSMQKLLRMNGKLLYVTAQVGWGPDVVRAERSVEGDAVHEWWLPSRWESWRWWREVVILPVVPWPPPPPPQHTGEKHLIRSSLDPRLFCLFPLHPSLNLSPCFSLVCLCSIFLFSLLWCSLSSFLLSFFHIFFNWSSWGFSEFWVGKRDTRASLLNDVLFLWRVHSCITYLLA